MTKVGNTRAGRPVPAPAPRDGFSCRSFLSHVGVLGMGAAVLSAGTARQAKAQYGPGSLDELSEEFSTSTPQKIWGQSAVRR